MRRIIAFGECMLEFTHVGGNNYQSGFSGDVLNMCVYLQRALKNSEIDATEVCFMTAVGPDRFSEEMVAGWKREQIDTALVFRSEDKQPGLYIINTDETGERYFTYWRDNSAAGQALACLKQAGGIDCLPEAEMFYFSGISLAILTLEDRQYLLEIIRGLRDKGTKIAFDPNYRPRLWPDAEEAGRWMNACYQLCDIALPGLEDEQALFSNNKFSNNKFSNNKFSNNKFSNALGNNEIATISARLLHAGVKEIIIKAGKQGNYGQNTEGRAFHVPFVAPDKCIDTTAAGDSFAGMYLAQRLQGRCPEQAAISASQTASLVVGYSGAIIPYDDFQTFLVRVSS